MPAHGEGVWHRRVLARWAEQEGCHTGVSRRPQSTEAPWSRGRGGPACPLFALGHRRSAVGFGLGLNNYSPSFAGCLVGTSWPPWSRALHPVIHLSISVYLSIPSVCLSVCLSTYPAAYLSLPRVLLPWGGLANSARTRPVWPTLRLSCLSSVTGPARSWDELFTRLSRERVFGAESPSNTYVHWYH